MINTIKILAADADLKICEQYRRRFMRIHGMELAYMTDSETDACAYVTQQVVDVVIMGLQLMEGDGFHLLNRLEQLEQKPIVMVVTDVTSSAVRGYVRAHGADYVCPKSLLFDPSQRMSATTKLQRSIQYELELMGFKHKMDGFTYLADAIEICVQQAEGELHVMYDIYPVIARSRNTTPARVERSIRWAIEQVFTITDISRLQTYYPYDYDSERGRPSNAEFILNVAQCFD